MKKRTVLGITAVVLGVALVLTGCSFGAKKGAWYIDFEKAQTAAEKSGKSLLVFFSGDDWDGKSASFKQSIGNAKGFAPALKKDFILVNIDFSQKEYESIWDVPEDASEKQKKYAQKMKELYEEKEYVAELYNLSEYPSIYLSTAEGYVSAKIPINEDDTLESFLKKIDDEKERVQVCTGIAKAISERKGIAKVKAIDDLYNVIPSDYRSSISDLIEEVLVLDKKNETGLVGKYQIQNAYTQAIGFAQTQDSKAASEVFVKLTESPYLTTEEKQEAYYTAAYVLTSSSDFDFERMLYLLDKAIETAPESENVSEIQGTIDALKQLQALQEVENSAKEAPEE